MKNRASWKPLRNVMLAAMGAVTIGAGSPTASAEGLFGQHVPGIADHSLAATGLDLFASVAPGQVDLRRNRFARTIPNMPTHKKTRKKARTDGPLYLAGSTSAAKLRSLIALAEAGAAGYDAVQYAARIKPPKRPTQMTLADIIRWIEDTPGQHHAIGRYQIIPSTLRSLMRIGRISPETVFSRDVQDAMADLLLRDAGYDRFACGRMKRQEFMENLARIWAGLPTATGRSAYHGQAGNRATITWARFSDAISTAFPIHVIEANVSSPGCQRANS